MNSDYNLGIGLGSHIVVIWPVIESEVEKQIWMLRVYQVQLNNRKQFSTDKQLFIRYLEHKKQNISILLYNVHITKD